MARLQKTMKTMTWPVVGWTKSCSGLQNYFTHQPQVLNAKGGNVVKVTQAQRKRKARRG
jgi:hypothetical protein